MYIFIKFNKAVKYSALFLLSCLQATSCYYAKNDSFINDLQQDNIKGAAKKIIIETYLIEDTKHLTLVVVDSINSTGYLITDSINELQDKRITRNQFIYNGGILTEILTSLNGKKSSSTLFELSDNGKTKTVKYFNSAGRLEHYYDNIVLNQFGLLISAFSYNGDGKVIGYSENHYIGTQLVEGYTKNTKGIITYRFSMFLNKAQDPASTREVVVNGDSTITSQTSYGYNKFDNKRNWTEQISYKNGKAFKITRRIISYYGK